MERSYKIPPTSFGELFIIDYFKKKKIKFESEKVISDLRNDTKSFRRADFYLPQYKIYVEFFGEWHKSIEDRERYTEKMKVYSFNKKRVVYLYPDNLGFLDFIFEKKIHFIFRKYKMKREFLKYKFFVTLRKVFSDSIMLFFIGLVFLICTFTLKTNNYEFLFVTFSILTMLTSIFYFLYELIRVIRSK